MELKLTTFLSLFFKQMELIYQVILLSEIRHNIFAVVKTLDFNEENLQA